VLTSHPPERARHAGSVVLHAGCCCCCCCLHSVGGIIGGIVGTVYAVPARPRPVPPDFASPFRRGEPANDEGIVRNVEDISSGPNPLSPEVWEKSQGLHDVSASDPELTSSALLPAANLYWLLVVILTFVVVVWASHPEGPGSPVALVIAALVLPAVQLGASLLGAILVGLFYTDKRAGLARIGRITLWSLVGTVAGFAVMGGFCIMLRR
jgi:hypothetical protein